MIYVAARPPERLAALLSSGQGPVVLVVPNQSLADGRPRGVRGPMYATFEVSGCRGFMLGTRREVDRVKARETSAA
jgi:hypothetical protein